jgi:hypothetical protein
MSESCPLCGVFETASAAELATHVDQCLNEQDERMARDLAAQESKGARSAGSNGKSEQAAILFCVRLIQ